VGSHPAPYGELVKSPPQLAYSYDSVLCRSAQIFGFEVALNLDEKKTNGAPFDMWVEKGG